MFESAKNSFCFWYSKGKKHKAERDTFSLGILQKGNEFSLYGDFSIASILRLSELSFAFYIYGRCIGFTL